MNEEIKLSECLPDETDLEIERLYGDFEARVLKYKAQYWIKVGFLKDKAHFSSTLDKFLMRKYAAREKNLQKLHYGKIAYTVAIQLASIAVLVTLAFTPLWPLTLITVPLLLGLNYYWLLKDTNGR